MPSELAVTTFVPSGLNATLVSASSCPSSVACSVPSGSEKMRAERSLPAVTAYWSLNEKSAATTLERWPLNWLSSWQVCVLQMRVSPWTSVVRSDAPS